MHEHTGFDDRAATWDDNPGHESRQVAVARAIEQVLNLDPATSAVDVGDGTGRLSILLADRVSSVVVTDPSARMVKVAQERIETDDLAAQLIDAGFADVGFTCVTTIPKGDREFGVFLCTTTKA